MKLWFYILLSGMVIASCVRKTDPDESENEIGAADWSLENSIPALVRHVQIPERSVSIEDYGGIGDGMTDNTTAFKSAIDSLADEGGGTIIIPPGNYFTGPIHLKSDIHLFLDESATITFIAESAIYPVEYTWFNGIPCMNYSPMIYAKDQENISISGKGTINGQGNDDLWYYMKFKEEIDWNLLKNQNNTGVKPEFRHFGEGYNLRPNLMGFYNCDRIEVEGIRIINAPYWNIHAVLSTNIVIRGISIEGDDYDVKGISPESSQYVIIENVKINNVNDAIMICAGQDGIQDNKPAENILIRHANISDVNYNGLGVGLHISADVRKIFISNTSVSRSKRAFSIKTNPKNGGIIEDLYIRDCYAFHIDDPVLYINVFHGSDNRADVPIIRNIHFKNIKSDSCGRALYFMGSIKQPLKNIVLDNCSFQSFKSSYVEDAQNVELNYVNINDQRFNLVYSIGDIQSDENDDEDILDTYDITIDELPETIKSMAVDKMAGRPITDIAKKITKTGIVYVIRYRNESAKDSDLVVSSDGKILRYEVEISLSDLPENVLRTFEKVLGSKPLLQQITRIRVSYAENFQYYEIEAETMDRIIKAEIASSGELLEMRERAIKNPFPPLSG